MRDYLVIAAVLTSLPFCFIRPYIGLLVWSGLGYLNPHRMTWGPAYTFPVVQLAAITTIAGTVFTKRRKGLYLTTETILLILLWLTFTFSTFFAINSAPAWIKWEQVSKTMLMIAFTIVLVDSHKQLRGLFWVFVICVGFWGFKGGIFELATGGNWLAYGPTDSSFGDNNSLGAILCMIIPLCWYIRKAQTNYWIRIALLAGFWLCTLTVIFTYSRGDFLGLLVMMSILIWQSKRRFLYILVAVMLVVLALPFFPHKWIDRIQTIQTYQEDSSANARLSEWRFARNLAADRPLTGGGFKVYSRATYNKYLPEFGNWWDAHSIYFGMLAEHGFPGITLFLVLLFTAFRSLHKLKLSYGRDRPEYYYCIMLTSAFAGYMAAGAFLDFHYLDLFYQMIACVIIMKRQRKEELAPKAVRAEEQSIGEKESLCADMALDGRHTQ